MRKLLLALALVGAPSLAVAQQPAQTPAKPAAVMSHDTTKAKPKSGKRHNRSRKPATARDSTKAKPAAKPN